MGQGSRKIFAGVEPERIGTPTLRTRKEGRANRIDNSHQVKRKGLVVSGAATGFPSMCFMNGL